MRFQKAVSRIAWLPRWLTTAMGAACLLGIVLFFALPAQPGSQLTLSTNYPPTQGVYRRLLTTEDTSLGQDGTDVDLGTPADDAYAVSVKGMGIYRSLNLLTFRHRDVRGLYIFEDSGGQPYLKMGATPANKPLVHVQGDLYVSEMRGGVGESMSMLGAGSCVLRRFAAGAEINQTCEPGEYVKGVGLFVHQFELGCPLGFCLTIPFVWPEITCQGF